MYDPTIGRWFQEDPIGCEAGDPDLLRYTGNSPTIRTDPSGLQEQDETTVPQLTISSPIKQPVAGLYGAFIWPAIFKLDKPTKTGGWIIQELHIKKSFFDKDEKDVTATVMPTNTRFDYWEAWSVMKGATTSKDGIASPKGILLFGILLGKLADEMKIEKLDANPNYKLLLQLSKDIQAGTWKDVNDVFFQPPANLPPASVSSDNYAKGKTTYDAKVFFVENADLPPAFWYNRDYLMRERGKLEFSKDCNQNPSGDLKNLSISPDKDGHASSAEGKSMEAWITANYNNKLGSNIIERNLTATWDSTGTGIVTTVTVKEGPWMPKK